MFATQGTYDEGINKLTFVAVPDLTINTTALTEGAAPTPKALAITVVDITPTQYGDLVSVTDLAKRFSPFDISAVATERITRQAKESIDKVSRDVIAAGGTAFYADAVANRAALAAANKLDAVDLRRLRATMFKGKIPPFGDGYYRLMVSPEQGFDLRSDTTTGGWIDVNKYATPETLLKGELGRMEGFRIMEIVNAPTFASTVTVHAAIAVGDLKGWGAGDLQSLRIYHVPAGGDHKDPLAQEELVGWKVAFGVAVLASTYYYRAESAATAL
jgi:N4-gp56 family major capsid protein